jgi:polyribonucleotide nucleotidyltransferase
MREALAQAKTARTSILGTMAETIAEPRAEMSPWAPRIVSIKIDPERIGTVIGKGGETIRGLEADYQVEISIEDDGQVNVYGIEGALADAAVEAIRTMTKDVEVGDTYTGAKVVKTTAFGAFVELSKGVDGLLHISNLGAERVERVEDVLNRGDAVDVKVVEVDKARGRIGLRMVGPDGEVIGESADAGDDAEGGDDEDGDGRPKRRRRRRRLAASESE